MDAIKEKQLENIVVAYAAVLETPAKKIYPHLDGYANQKMQDAGPTACGACFCFGGLIAVTPYFMAQGIAADVCGVPVLTKETRKSPRIISEELFGDPETFSYRLPHEIGSDKQVILRRLERAADALLSQ